MSSPSVPRCLIFCEGKDDKAVFEALSLHLGISDLISIEFYDGTSKFSSFVENSANRSDIGRGVITRLLVTMDADSDPGKAWEQIRNEVLTTFKADLNGQNEWLQSANFPDLQVAGLVIPSPDSPGMIETLLLEAAKQADDKYFDCLETFYECLENKIGKSLHPKTKFGMWVLCELTQRRPAPLSEMINSSKINWDMPAFEALGIVLKGMLPNP